VVAQPKSQWNTDWPLRPNFSNRAWRKVPHTASVPPDAGRTTEKRHWQATHETRTAPGSHFVAFLLSQLAMHGVEHSGTPNRTHYDGVVLLDGAVGVSVRSKTALV